MRHHSPAPNIHPQDGPGSAMFMSPGNFDAPLVRNAAGVPFGLGAIIAHTGDGTLYRVPTDARLVAKVYHSSLTPQATDKLRTMLSLENNELRRLAVWPTGLLYSKDGKDPIGFLMPLVEGRVPLSRLVGPKAQAALFPNSDWRFLVRVAMNTARGFNAVSRAGCVVGNVNPANILIGKDGSVALAGCDGFHIAPAGFSAGNDAFVTLLAPELQDKAFGGLLRDIGHDKFALSVLIFQLLFSGRHPFAGRYLGAEDLPISKAIAEFRFAYGARRSAHMMEQPPRTPALSMVGAEVAALFERAFGKSAVRGGRPSAGEWVAALGRLEQSLKPCHVDSVHWHHAAVSCPWCQMASEGTPAAGFTAEELPLATGDSFEALWQQVEILDPPGEAPNIREIASSPSEAALAVRRKITIAHVTAFGIAGTLITAGILAKIEAIHPAWFIGAGALSFFLTHSLLNTDNDEAAIKRRLSRAREQWEAAEAEWTLRAGTDEFSRQKASLQELRNKWDQLPALRARQLDELRKSHWANQRSHYLDGYLIAEARVHALDIEALALLSSYSVETAADIDITKFNAIPGLSTRAVESLIAWRTSLERDFLYNPNLPDNPHDIAKIERGLRGEKMRLQTQLADGVSKLNRVRRDIEAARRNLKDRTEEAYRSYAQAQTDAAVLA